MNKTNLKKVVKDRDILEASGIAHTTWREHYASILSPGQIEYMLQELQSPDAIAKAINEGYEYYLIRRLGVSAGYLSIKPNDPQGKMFLSKIYLLAEYRGKGLASDVVAQLSEMCKKLRLQAIWLTVNKNNPSIGPYKKLGFETVDEAVTDIGGGYVMDDYIMEKQI